MKRIYKSDIGRILVLYRGKTAEEKERGDYSIEYINIEEFLISLDSEKAIL